MASSSKKYVLTDSESDENEDYSPSDGEVRPPAKNLSSTAQKIAAPTRPLRLNVTGKPSGLRNQVLTEDDSDKEGSTSGPASKRASLGRTSKAQRKVIVERSSDDDDDDDLELDDEEDEEDREGDRDAEGDEDEEMEEASDASGDEEMSEATPAPMPAPPPKARTTIKLNNGPARKPSPQSILKIFPKIQSVEEKEMTGTEDDEDDDSPLNSDEESISVSDDDDLSEDGQPADADALDTIRASAIGDDELDSSDSDLAGSRDGTPDPTKQTRRQRAENDSLMALSNEAQKKKFFTQEQVIMRRTEMARRRKDLSEKRNEQEKLDTLDRLLHKRAPVRRTRAQMMADAEREQFGTPGRDDDVARAKSGFVRTISGYDGTRVGVPDEWIGKEVGRPFEGTRKMDVGLRIVRGSRMVQEVE